MTTYEPTRRDTPPLRGQRAPSGLADLVRNVGYELMPFKSTEETVATHVPTDIPLTVTVTEAKGIGATIELSERLRARGYDVAPHLAARLFTDEDEVASVVERLRAAGIDRVFVIGGDAARPSGPFKDAISLLETLDRIGHSFSDVGIGGYPEGHGSIAPALLAQAISHKAAHATRVVTQICFDADATATWADRLAAQGVNLPVYVGMPGPVNRQKLIRISAGLGLGQSARFLHKQQGLWRFLLPGGYNPGRLARRLGDASRTSSGNIRGLHIFTFNELEGTEKWRRRLRAQLGLE
jgi:methylenetetrahydrofolate reductase (NADPH)